MSVATIEFRAQMSGFLKNRYIRAGALMLAVLFLVQQKGCFYSDETRFNGLKDKGIGHFRAGRYGDAVDDLIRALEIVPEEPEACFVLGLTWFQLAEGEKALKWMETASASAPGNPRYRMELAKFYLVSGMLDKCEKIINSKAAKDPIFNVLKGDFALLMNRPVEAAAYYLKASRIEQLSTLATIRLAICRLSQKKNDLAEKNYRIVEARSPTTLDVLLEMATYWKVADNFGEAEAILLKSETLYPKNLTIKKAIAEFYFGHRKYERASKIVEEVLAQTPENLSVRKLKIDILLCSDHPERAKGMLPPLLAKYPKDADLKILQGRYALLMGDFQRAAMYFEAAVILRPNVPANHYLLALAFLGGGQNHLAEQRLTRALVLDPYFTRAELAISGYYYRDGELDLGMEYVSRLLEREPGSFRAHMIKGNIFLAQRRFSEAMLSFRSAEMINPDSPHPLYFMALASEMSNRVERALSLYERLLEREPGLADAADRYARLLMTAGKEKAAKVFFEKAVSGNPDNGYLHQISGNIYLEAGEYHRAEQSFEKAVSSNPRLEEAYLRLSRIHFERGDRNRGIKTLERCISSLPRNPDAYGRLSRAYLESGDSERSISTLEEAVSRGVESPTISNDLAWLYLEIQARPERALPLALSAYERQPGEPAILDTLGWVYYRKGIYGQALWYLEDASTIEPRNPLIHFHLGLVYLAMGEKTKAAANLGQALALDLKTPNDTIARGLLGKMGTP